MNLTLDLDCFSPDYASARNKFIAGCKALRGKLTHLCHPLTTPEQPLGCDVFWYGPENAARVLIIISATHGVEGFCGSAAQIQWLRHDRQVPDDTAILLLHALNPFGFAHCRRVNEDNIDLNRNFIDFSNPPDNPGYQALAPILLSEQSLPLEQIQQHLAAFRQRHDQSALEQAVSGGQYQFADGLFFGGFKPSWSNHLISRLFQEYRLIDRKRLAVIDIHSGLGPYGYGEIICDHPPGSPGTRLAKRWFGDSVTEPACGTSTSVPKHGLLDYAWHPIIGDKGCYVTLEFGTYSLERMFEVVQQENYCWHRDVDEQDKRIATLAMRDYFYPEHTDWQEMILFRSQQVITQAMQGLSA